MSQIVPARWRLYRWRMLPRVDVRWFGLVLEMRYVPSRSTWHELDALLAAERAECPWLVWELRYDRGWPLVRIQADPQDYLAIAAIAFVATGGSAATPPAPDVGRVGVTVSDDAAGLTHRALCGDRMNNVNQRAIRLGGTATFGPSDPAGTTLH